MPSFILYTKLLTPSSNKNSALILPNLSKIHCEKKLNWIMKEKENKSWEIKSKIQTKFQTKNSDKFFLTKIWDRGTKKKHKMKLIFGKVLGNEFFKKTNQWGKWKIAEIMVKIFKIFLQVRSGKRNYTNMSRPSKIQLLNEDF